MFQPALLALQGLRVQPAAKVSRVKQVPKVALAIRVRLASLVIALQ
jgi:hypothetical protein